MPNATQLRCTCCDLAPTSVRCKVPTAPGIRTDANTMTIVPGVYAAGDLTMTRHNATLASTEGVLEGMGEYQALVFGNRKAWGPRQGA